MPTSSQSKILSTVDYHLQQQQQGTNPDGATKPLIHPKSAHPSLGERRLLKTTREEQEEEEQQQQLSGPSSSNLVRRRSSLKFNDVPNSSRSPQRGDPLSMPVINLNTFAPNDPRIPVKSGEHRRSSLQDELDDPTKRDYKLKQMKTYSSPRHSDNDEHSPLSDYEYIQNYEDEIKRERRGSLLNDTARRLLVLGTIRPSRTFYKDLPEGDVEYLMEYFRRMRNSHRSLTSEEINQELKKKYVEYKPKIFFDSSCVTKNQVRHIEQYVEPYADQIRSDKAELSKLENPIRFIVREKPSERILTTIPHEFNECLLTLISHADPLRKSELISELVSQRLLTDIKDNSLDISYFPGGVNYDVPREEINEDGQMNLDTYKKIKQRLSHRKIWYFSGAPEKKINALVVTVPVEYPSRITHQCLLEILFDRLKSLPTDNNFDVHTRIVSIEFLPLSCIFSSFDVANQFIVDCDGNQTKQHLLEQPLKVTIQKQVIVLETHSYDEYIQKEYQTYLKAEKYRELVKNHDEAVKRTSASK